MTVSNKRESIRVCVRVRPPSPQEFQRDPIFQSERNGLVVVDAFIPDKNDDVAATVTNSAHCIGTQRVTLQPGGNDRTFVMDRVFDICATQQEVYEAGAKPIVESVLQGFNGAVLAYGQTSSGKTYTMEGPVGLCEHGSLLMEDTTEQGIPNASESLGIIPRMVCTLFRHIENADEHIEFQLKVSILEIYNEKLKDLIDPTKTNLRIREDKNRGIFVEDLSEWFVTTPKDVFDCIRVGQLNRATAGTNMNAQSSRSHLIFCLSVQQKNAYDLSTKTGKLYLVDLAGSEKVAKTGAEGQTLDEAKMINKSLACLGNVINALTRTGGKTSSRSHIPYRDSKLTRVLEETLGGNSKTCLICTVSPSVLNEAETLSTLRFGQRAKLIVNKAVINEGRSLEAVERLLVKAEEKIAFQSQYIVSLESLLRASGIAFPNGGTSSILSSNDNSQLSSTASPERRSTNDSSPARSDQSDTALQSPGVTSARVAVELFELQEEVSIKNSRLKDQSQEISDLKRQLAELMETLKRQQYQQQQHPYLQQRHESWTSMGVPPAPRPEQPMEKMSTTASMMSLEEETDDPTTELAHLKLQLANLQEVLEDERKRTKALRAICQNDNKPFQQKLEEIDVHLQQLTTMYQNAVDKNAGLKLECQKKDAKIEQKNRSITQLEKNLGESRQKYERLLSTCQSLSEVVASRSSSTSSLLQQAQNIDTNSSGNGADASTKRFDFNNVPFTMNNSNSPTASSSLPSGHNESNTTAAYLWNFYNSFHAPTISKRLNIVKPLKGGGGAQERAKPRHSFLSSLVGGGGSSSSEQHATNSDVPNATSNQKRKGSSSSISKPLDKTDNKKNKNDVSNAPDV